MKKVFTSLSLLASLALSNPNASAVTFNPIPDYRAHDFHLALENKENGGLIDENNKNNFTIQAIDSVDGGPDPESSSGKISGSNCIPGGQFSLTDIDLSFLDTESIEKGVHIIAVDKDGTEYDLGTIDAKQRAIPSTTEFIYIGSGSFASVSYEGVYTLKLHYKSKTIIPAKKKGGKAEIKRNDKKIPLVNKKNTPITIDCKNIKAESFSTCEYLSAGLEGNIGNSDSIAILINDPRIQSISKPTLRVGIVDYPIHIHGSMSYFVIPYQLIKKSPKANLKIMSNGKVISQLPTIEDIAQNLSGEDSPSKSVTLNQETKSIKPGVKYKIKPATPSFITNESILVNGAKVEILSIDSEKGTYEFIMPQLADGAKKINIEFKYTASGNNNTIKIGSRDTDPKEKEVKDPTLQNLTVTKDGSVSFVKPKNFTCNIVGIVFRVENGKERGSNTQVDMIITEKITDGETYITATPQSIIPSTNQGTVKCQIFFNTGPSTNNVGSRIITLPKS